MVEWLEYPTPFGEGLSSIPARVKLYSVCSMDVMIKPPKTFLTLDETIKSLMVGRKKVMELSSNKIFINQIN